MDTSEGKSPMQLKDRENGSKVGTFRTVVTQHMSQLCRISVSIETLEISNCARIHQNGAKTVRHRERGQDERQENIGIYIEKPI